VLTMDTIGLKRTMEQLDRLAQEIPSLHLHARMVRAEYHYLKGEYEQGFAIAQPVIESTTDRAFIGRTFAISSEARALNRLKQHAEAKALVEPLVERLSEADKEVVAHYSSLSVELAHAYSGLGEHDKAVAIIEAMIERYARSEHPLLMGNLYATATSVAVVAGEVPRALDYLMQMEQAFRPTGNPALIGRWEHMRREVRRLLKDRAPEAVAALGGIESTADDAGESAVALLSQCNGADQRARFALDLLINHTHGKRGFLFSFEQGDLRLIAPQHGVEPSTELVDRIREDIEAEIDRDEVTVVTDSPARSSLPPPLEPPPARMDYRTHLLRIPHEGGLRVVGAVAIEAEGRAVSSPQQSFLQRIARSLFEAGDAGKTEVQTR
jgi:tetratricopeptide (TPR) repeat protein